MNLSCASFFVCTRGFFASSRSRAHRSMTLPLATEDDMVAARGEAVAEAERTAAAATASGALSSRETKCRS